MFAAYIYYDPYVDITENNVLLWYKKKAAIENILFYGREKLN